MSTQKDEDTVALRKLREQKRVELGAKDGDRKVLTDYMVDEVDLGYNRQGHTQMIYRNKKIFETIKMKRVIKGRAGYRTTISELMKKVEAELDDEAPSEKFIRTNYRIMEEYMVKLQEEDKLIWYLMIDDEDNTSRELEEEQDTVIQLEWLGWWAQFSTIHEESGLSDVDELQYLVKAIKEDTRASRLVKSFTLTADNYPKFIAALKDRFGDRVILTEIYVRQLLGLVINNARRTTMTIENLYEKLESYLRSLESLGVTQDQNATFMYPMVETSLPEELIQVWQRSSISGYDVEGKDKPQSLNQRLGSLLKFLRQEVKGEERLNYVRAGFGESSKIVTKPYTTRPHGTEVRDTGNSQPKVCLLCRGGHWLPNCRRWIAMPVKERRGLLGRHKACFHCLRVGHYGRHCKRYIKCKLCSKHHNTFLHSEKILNIRESPSKSEPREVSIAGMHVNTLVPRALLATALVRLVNHRNEEIVVGALLDRGSQSSILHKNVLQMLNISVSKVNAQIYGVNSIKGEEVRELAHFVIKPLGKEEWKLPLQALLVNKMTGLLPGRNLCLPLSEELRNTQLADPQFEKSGKVDLILGADVYGSIFLPGIRRSEKTQLCAQNTRLGWILSRRLTGGDILGTTQVFSTRVQYEDNMEVILKKFWEVEIRLTTKTTPEDEFCGALYKTEVKRTSSRGCVVPLPFDPKLTETELFGGSFATCVQWPIEGGGFVSKKWASNDTAILKDIPEESRLQLIMFEDTEVVKTLGVGWNPKEDCFVYNLQCTSATELPNAKCYHLWLNYMIPWAGWHLLLLLEKIMIQQLWVTGAKWNEPIDFTIRDLWRKFRDELKYLRSIRIPRWLGLEGMQEIHLHGFCDASGDAYAAAVYLKVPNYDNQVRLLAAKTSPQSYGSKCLKYQDQDGVVRVVSLRTKTGIIKRPLVKLAFLPVPTVCIDGTHQRGEEC
ncbi:hypothetical protein LAZ67_12001885 [Cordylochernes scorpioides]|uniref:CCHC-type domain-containing protein n=1 Tax=Cordylochernes scorpioides TaxID=51811 RepID=A0ABY6L1E1_9ARAC|nr:hypothetical protein LAZ67_12001885 [Cordylochernes scorpioides]